MRTLIPRTAAALLAAFALVAFAAPPAAQAASKTVKVGKDRKSKKKRSSKRPKDSGPLVLEEGGGAQIVIPLGDESSGAPTYGGTRGLSVPSWRSGGSTTFRANEAHDDESASRRGAASADGEPENPRGRHHDGDSDHEGVSDVDGEAPAARGSAPSRGTKEPARKSSTGSAGASAAPGSFVLPVAADDEEEGEPEEPARQEEPARAPSSLGGGSRVAWDDDAPPPRSAGRSESTYVETSVPAPASARLADGPGTVPISETKFTGRETVVDVPSSKGKKGAVAAGKNASGKRQRAVELYEPPVPSSTMVITLPVAGDAPAEPRSPRGKTDGPAEPPVAWEESRAADRGSLPSAAAADPAASAASKAPPAAAESLVPSEAPAASSQPAEKPAEAPARSTRRPVAPVAAEPSSSVPEATAAPAPAPAAPSIDPFEKLERDLKAIEEPSETPKAEAPKGPPARKPEVVPPVAPPVQAPVLGSAERPSSPRSSRDPSVWGVSFGGGAGVAVASDPRGGFTPDLALGGYATWNPSFLGPFAVDASWWRAARSDGTPFITVASTWQHMALRVLYTHERGRLLVGFGGGVLATASVVDYRLADTVPQQADASIVRMGADATILSALRFRPLEVRVELRALLRGGLRLDLLPTLGAGLSF